MTEINPFAAPASTLSNNNSSAANTSGLGAGHPMPDGIKGWSWGAFAWGWLWAVFNKTWIGLLCFVPYIGFVMKIYLGIKGRELAWQNKHWDSVEHFNAVQRKWSIWALVFIGVAILGVFAAIAIPMLSKFSA